MTLMATQDWLDDELLELATQDFRTADYSNDTDCYIDCFLYFLNTNLTNCTNMATQDFFETANFANYSKGATQVLLTANDSNYSNGYAVLVKRRITRIGYAVLL